VEIETCFNFLDREISLVGPRVFLALGAIAWSATLRYLLRRGHALPKPRPKFAHGAELRLSSGAVILGCYHVSQQNTQTGKLTPEMFDTILSRARALSISQTSPTLA
jgi:uracil-DNA glycosylase